MRLTEDGHRAVQALCELFTNDIELAMSETDPAERASLERLLHGASTVLHHRATDPTQLAELRAAARESVPPTSTQRPPTSTQRPESPR